MCRGLNVSCALPCFDSDNESTRRHKFQHISAHHASQVSASPNGELGHSNHVQYIPPQHLDYVCANGASCSFYDIRRHWPLEARAAMEMEKAEQVLAKDFAARSLFFRPVLLRSIHA